MDWFSMETLAALFSILMIDIVLSGDNAIVIALASRNLPTEQQKKAIFWGTFGAIAIRVLLTAIVVLLLKIPFLQLAGGLLLIWIALKLLIEEKGHEIDPIKAGSNLRTAIQTIIFADVVMSLDNVLAVAGAARGHITLIIIGVAISIPIMVWGSRLILKMINRFPIIVQIGVAILAWTAGDMILKDRQVIEWFGSSMHILEWVLPITLIIAVLLIGNGIRRRTKKSLHKQVSESND